MISAEFGITQPAVSQHLRVLRDNGFAAVRAGGDAAASTRSTRPASGEAEQWLTGLRAFWSQRLDALGTELARGRRARRAPTDPTPESRRTPDP